MKLRTLGNGYMYKVDPMPNASMYGQAEIISHQVSSDDFLKMQTKLFRAASTISFAGVREDCDLWNVRWLLRKLFTDSGLRTRPLLQCFFIPQQQCCFSCSFMAIIGSTRR